MVVVYRVPAVVPDHVRAAFEGRGIRLLPGDRVVVEDGQPAVMRELDRAIIPFLHSLPVDYAEGCPLRSAVRPGPRRRRGDRPPYLRLETDREETA